MYFYLKNFLLFFLFLSSNLIGDDEFFHQFDVGQGNCQLVTYISTDGTQVGVMYDAGTSSQQQHLKFQQNPRKRELISNAPLSVFDFPVESASRDGSHSSSDDSAATTISAETQKRNVSIIDTIQEKCKCLNHLFVFLSHPDRDHINLLKDVIPSNIDITVFLCGDWLGDGGANDKYDDVSIYVKGVLDFLTKRIKNRGLGDGQTNFSLPYYWSSAPIAYRDIKKSLLGRKVTTLIAADSSLSRGIAARRNFATRDLFDLFKIDFQQQRHVPSQIFKGNLRKLVGHAMGQGDIPTKAAASLAKIPGMETIFQYVYIWSLNQAADDANNQSAIVSCSLPDKKMTFVFSGDAHDLVFKNAGLDEDEPEEAAWIRDTLGRDDHLVWLTLPHHGSANNESFFAWNLFKPSGILVSAGNYKDFGHPSYDLISRIAKTKSKIWRFGMQVMDEHYRFLAFDKNKTGKTAVRTGALDAEHIPILCPNIMGSISMAQQGEHLYVYQEGFSPIVEDDQKKSYLVEYSRQLSGTWNLGGDGQLYNGTISYTPLGNGIYQNSTNFVWVVKEKTNVITYKIELITKP